MTEVVQQEGQRVSAFFGAFSLGKLVRFWNPSFCHPPIGLGALGEIPCTA
jgi:hypothetical protein